MADTDKYARQRAYRIRNSEKIRLANKKYRDDHKVEIRERQKKYYERNKEKVKKRIAVTNKIYRERKKLESIAENN